MYLARSPQRELTHRLPQRLTTQLTHVAKHRHVYGSMGPLNDFEIDFTVGLHVQDSGQEDLTQLIRLKSLGSRFLAQVSPWSVPPYYRLPPDYTLRAVSHARPAGIAQQNVPH
jgi:hypothetical protein